ncbi:glycosyltransferase [Pseudokineococcus sp. 1T1Z-3]|uniref:glycosyltransferase n=1 Tax=Pseudokineococcus sp. 1T1Z-3 TaxID=3132745 RepID=UPI0030A4BA74
MKVLHVVNYGWPHVDGYTVRSRSLVVAQRRELGYETSVAASAYPVFARASDPALVVDGWGPGQHQVVPRAGRLGRVAERVVPGALQRAQRPALGLAPLQERAAARGLLDVVDAVQPDVVHAHHPAYAARAARAAARARGLPFVYELRCFNGDYDLDARNPYYLARGRRQNALEAELARSADHVVTIADGLARRLRAAGVPEERLSVVRNAVDTARFTPQDRSGHDPSVLRVGYATTFEAIENVDALVGAAALARDELARQGRRLEVTVAGAGRDLERVRALVADRGLQDLVDLPGFVPIGAMPQWYADLDLFVVPRKAAAVAADTTPLKPLEALATGLPLLVSDLPAMRELLAGRAGVELVEASPQPLADAVLRFARAPWTPPQAPDLGDRAWSREVHRYPEVYRRARETAAARRAGTAPSGAAAGRR